MSVQTGSNPALLKPPQPLKRWAWRIARVAVVAYLGLALVLAMFQTWFIFPGAATQGRRDAMVTPSERAEIVTLATNTGDKVVALFGAALTPQGTPHPDARSRPTILYFYGNGMCMADCVGDFMKLRRRGFNMMVPDYLGYGMSGGKPSEQNVYATADACFDHLSQRPDIDPARIIPFGWSLGAGAAVHLASTRQVPRLVLVSAFTSVADMGRRLFPYLPTSLFLKHRFENERKLREIRLPVFIAHGTRDSIIPFDMAAKNAAAAGGKVTRHDVIDGDHNNIFDVGKDELADAIARFIDSPVDSP
ncbi:MAG: alpha/beta hydrolase [Tepidisphaeraceae bacterium]